jgi:hypothetical protein
MSHVWFEISRSSLAAEYERFKLATVHEGLVEKQELVGTYYETEDDDGDDLVSSMS